jgi:hypothetical protein
MINEKRQRNPIRKEYWKQFDTSYRQGLKPSVRGMTKIAELMGVTVYADEYTEESEHYYYNKYALDCIKNMARYYYSMFQINISKGVVVVITDFYQNPYVKRQKLQENPAFYMDKMIFMDSASVSKRYYWIHEYAHYLSYKTPKRFVEIATNEYNKMLSEYFKKYVNKRTRRKTLEGEKYDNATHRELMADKLGLPTEYASTNMDEFFAEMISHWDKIPNNKLTFNLKKMVRKILMSIH